MQNSQTGILWVRLLNPILLLALETAPGDEDRAKNKSEPEDQDYYGLSADIHDAGHGDRLILYRF